MIIELEQSIIFSNTIDDSIRTFTSVVEKCAKPLFQKKNIYIHEPLEDDSRVHTSNSPWFDNECADNRYLFYRHLNLFRGNKSEVNRNLVQARSKYKASLRKARYKYDVQQTEKLNKLRYKNARDYWKLLKSVSTSGRANIPLTEFERYFKSVNNPDSKFYVADENILLNNDRYIRGEIDVMFEELNLPITQREISKSIKQLKNKKSAGPDRLLNEFFIHGEQVLLPYIEIIFTAILNNGYFPEDLSVGEIVPLHKKGSLNSVDNYRGITLLSAFGKLFTRVLNNRLTEWAEEYSVYVEAQAGFREPMGTTDHIFSLHGIISHYVNTRKRLYCAFVDFSKTFDYVVRDNLWFKLIKLGVRGKILNVIMSMYNNVKSKVEFNNEKGEEFICHTGVRQGECLSPYLFSMFVNDLESELIEKGVEGLDLNFIKLFLLMYADDIVIFSETEVGLQNGLDVLFDYCNKWKLTVNAQKTKIVIFRKRGMVSRQTRFYYGDLELEIVNKFTYLGIVFTVGGSFAEAHTALAGQALKSIFALNKYVRKFVNLKPKHVLDLFDKLVKPILSYSSEVWGFSQAMVIERVHLQFCKTLGVKLLRMILYMGSLAEHRLLLNVTYELSNTG